MVYRIAAIIIGLVAIGLAIHKASLGTFSYRELWPVALGITFVGYGVGSKRGRGSFRVPFGSRSVQDPNLHKEVPKSVEIVVKVISVLIIIFISLFLVIAVIAFLSIL